MNRQIPPQSHTQMENSTYLNMILSESDQTPEHVLLPPEEAAGHETYGDKVDSFQKIIDEKVSVTGGDDWHDGAFRATDNEARIVTESVAAIAPFLGATVVGYPNIEELRVTLGSRVVIKQGRASFPVDIVGFRSAYPRDVIDEATGEEVMAASPDSPIGAAILGKQVGEEATYASGDRTLSATIESLSQVAVQMYFQDASRLILEVEN
jgi:transcription elongation GreA/GreB family factor